MVGNSPQLTEANDHLMQVVDEKDTLVNFALSLKRHYLQTRQSSQQPLKKPRNATKVKAR